MKPQVYLIEEVADLLRLPVPTVIKAIELGEIKATRFAGEVRIPMEQFDALLHANTTSSVPDIIPFATSPAAGDHGLARRRLGRQGRNTDPEHVRRVRIWIWETLRKAGLSLSPESPASVFTTNGKQGIVSIATVESKVRPNDYFFGLPAQLLTTSPASFLMPVIAPRAEWPPRIFIVPYGKYRSFIDRWAVDHNHNMKYNIQEVSGRFFLRGKSMQPLDISEYDSVFRLLTQ